jgi:molecular chaperone Hsp33
LDTIVRCLLDKGRARVVAAITTDTVREIARRHAVNGSAAIALGRAASAGLMLATLTKDEEQVTLQVLGHGPFKGVTVDARSSGQVRAYLKHPKAVPWKGEGVGTRVSLAEAMGKDGLVNVIRDMGMSKNYAGQTKMVSGEIDQDVESYLQGSEQIDSILRCDTLLDGEGMVVASAGVLVQTLPQAEGAALVEFIRQSVDVERLSQILHEGQAIETADLVRAMLGPLEHELEILETRPVSFGCPCSQERAAKTLEMLHEEDLQAMILEDNQAQVTCNFCGQQYGFSESELELIRRKRAPQQPAS